MMRGLVRAAAVLLLLALALLSFTQQEVRFVLAGVAVLALVEIALVLRARRGRTQEVRDPSRVSAARIAYAEADGALSVTLTGEGQGRGPAPYVLLSRTLQAGAPHEPPRSEGPYLELSDRSVSVYGGIQEAYLSPHQLRLTLNARGAGALGAGDVCVTLATPGEQRRLERALARVLRGVRFTSDRDALQPNA